MAGAMDRSPHVTICVPVHNGRAFVADTLAAIQRQTHENLTVLISDDASDDGSPDICRAFGGDRRFRVVLQPSRRGWIDNCNWLLANAESDLVCIVSHDDLPEPAFVARLVAGVTAEPECVLAFTDVRVFGLLDHVEHQESICGDPAERVRAFIATHFDGTAFHGLIRRRAIEAAGGLRGNPMDHFAADVSWLARVAQAGEFRRIPEPLYRKRRHPSSASLQWVWSDEVRATAWCMHCRELLRDALDMKLSPAQQRRVVRAVLRRVIAIEPDRPFAFIRECPRSRQSAMVAAVMAELDGRERLKERLKEG